MNIANLSRWVRALTTLLILSSGAWCLIGLAVQGSAKIVLGAVAIIGIVLLLGILLMLIIRMERRKLAAVIMTAICLLAATPHFRWAIVQVYGHSVQATILGIDERTIDYRFQVPGETGLDYRQSQYVSENTYDRLQGISHVIVKYSPNNPNRSYLAGSDIDYELLSIPTLLFLVPGIFWLAVIIELLVPWTRYVEWEPE